MAKTKALSISLPAPYADYVERAKRVKGLTASELIRRALDAYMPENPIEDDRDGRTGQDGE